MDESQSVNPYDPPLTDTTGRVVSPEPSRASLATLIRTFLAGEITAFQFDDRLESFRDSDDPVIMYVVDSVWYHYDDCDDHLVCFSKQQWDYFQRLLLVLASNCRVETEIERQWSVKQLIAAVSLCVFVYCAVQVGWGRHLLIFSIPFGTISIALSFWQPRQKHILSPYAQNIFPFATFSDLATAYRFSDFRKKKYPNCIGERRIRSPFMDMFWQLYAYTVWLLLAPIPLLFQTLPDTRTHTRIVAV